MSNLTQKIIFDYPVIKSKDSNNKLKKLTGADAFKNSILLWMGSQKGDYIRDPLKGGYILPYLGKPMTDDRSIDIRDAIEIGIDEDFDFTFVISEIKVIPIYESEYWEIYIKGYSPDIKENIDLSIKLRNLT